MLNGIRNRRGLTPLCVNNSVPGYLICKVICLLSPINPPVPTVEDIAFLGRNPGIFDRVVLLHGHRGTELVTILFTKERYVVGVDLRLGVQHKALRHGEVALIWGGELRIEIPTVEGGTHFINERADLIAKAAEVRHLVRLTHSTTDELKVVTVSSVVERTAACFVPACVAVPFRAVLPLFNSASIPIVSINRKELLVKRRIRAGRQHIREQSEGFAPVFNRSLRVFNVVKQVTIATI